MVVTSATSRGPSSVPAPETTTPHPQVPGRPCSIAASLQIVGEKWALLAVREIYYGNHRFDAIVRNTGAPRDRMAARLRTLEASGIVERRAYSERPLRHEYHLTDAGQGLVPVIHALRTWGDRWAVDAPPVTFDHDCGHELDTKTVCRHCNREVRRDDVSLRIRSSGWDERGPTAHDAK